MTIVESIGEILHGVVYQACRLPNFGAELFIGCHQKRALGGYTATGYPYLSAYHDPNLGSGFAVAMLIREPRPTRKMRAARHASTIKVVLHDAS
jgi:hypothetical protein